MASNSPLAVTRTTEIVPIGALLDPEAQLAQLHALRDNHPLWSCRLFKACQSGALSRADMKYIFAQYQLYSRSFTRFISAVMANCDNDLFRSQLSENLWEEGGGAEPERRHAEIFRKFLRDGLDIEDPNATAYEPYARLFVREYLVHCLRSEPAAGAAFLSLGTEGIVARMYAIFVAGLKHAGIREEHLEFFHIHMACDDEHALTLERMMLSYADEPNWFDICARAMNAALDLRLKFFDDIMIALQQQRLEGMLSRINDKQSLVVPATQPSELRHRGAEPGPALYTNRVDAENIDFAVTRIPLDAEVLDPRRVSVPVGKRNERHRHAHETFLYFLAGSGKVHVDGMVLDVTPGDSVLVPRWAMHQTENVGDGSLEFLAVTDYHLTKRAFLGDAKAYRLDEASNLHRVE